MTRLCVAVGFCAVALAASSCTKTEAKTPGPAPITLKVPEPPTRLNIPVTAEPPPPPPVETEKPAPPPASTVKPKPTPTPAPAPTPPPANTETTPPVVQSARDAQFEQRAKEKLDAARRDLGKLRRESLKGEARDQFDSAEQFIRMTVDALQVRNYVYAASCADKAATLAALLVRQSPRR